MPQLLRPRMTAGYQEHTGLNPTTYTNKHALLSEKTHVMYICGQFENSWVNALVVHYFNLFKFSKKAFPNLKSIALVVGNPYFQLVCQSTQCSIHEYVCLTFAHDLLLEYTDRLFMTKFPCVFFYSLLTIFSSSLSAVISGVC